MLLKTVYHKVNGDSLEQLARTYKIEQDGKEVHITPPKMLWKICLKHMHCL
jgi:hypothetical protein